MIVHAVLINFSGIYNDDDKKIIYIPHKTITGRTVVMTANYLLQQSCMHTMPVLCQNNTTIIMISFDAPQMPEELHR